MRPHLRYLVAMLLRRGITRSSDIAFPPLVSFHPILLP